MRTHGNLIEHVTVNSDLLVAASNASATSMAYDMTDYDKIIFTAGIASHEGGNHLEFDVKESSNTTGTHSTSTSFPGATCMGSTNASHIEQCKAFLVTLATDATASTLALTVNNKNFKLTTSTLLLPAQTASAASALYFGSTVDSTDAEGLETMSSALASILNNTTFGIGNIATATTVSTAAVRVELLDTCDTYFTVGTTGGASAIIATVERAEVTMEVHAEDMSTGQKCLTLRAGTATTTMNVSLAVVRQGRRGGIHKHGPIFKST